ncbi:MAG: succinoglycan biosynthesis protein exov [Alteromonadaceae bacterium]|nr:succinoglycan biosynthesis protein exov [Alteromonadaceae bacterium]
MPIYYCKMPDGNVGDDLNEAIWHHYFDFSKIPESEQIIGIGSLLNHFIPEAKRYTVISSGVGYGTPPSLTDDWNIIAVRGKHSATTLGLTEHNDIVLLDGAYLLQDCYPLPQLTPSNQIGYIPHVASIDLGNWQEVCDKADVRFIDPRLPLDEFLTELSQCEKVICEAMHGAILADMMQVPWKPVKAYAHINTTKWDDWLSVFDKKAQFTRIQGVWGEHKLNGVTRFKNTIKKLIFAFIEAKNITQPIYNKSSENDILKTVEQLKVVKDERFYLNDQAQIHAKVSALKAALSKLDYYKQQNVKVHCNQPEVAS